MASKIVYQTLEDKGNIDHVEKHGPFPCIRANAWLGNGYYFWDSFIENAHWWGAEGADYCKRSGYMICEAKYEFDENRCFNLIDNPTHFNMFNSTKKLMQEKKLYIQNQTTVARIIEYLKTTLQIFKFEATRVYGINSTSFNSVFANRTVFDARFINKYLDSVPAIQICFYTKTSLNLTNLKVIFPDEYHEDYVG